jgi:hypothetical protein
MVPNITVYDCLYGRGPDWGHFSLPGTTLQRRITAILARRLGIKRLSVWPAPLLEATAELRNILGPAPFCSLRVLITRIRLASVSFLLSLVPQLSGLELFIVDDNVAGQETVLFEVAEKLPQLSELAVRFDGPFTLNLDVLTALSHCGTLTVLDLRAGSYTRRDALVLNSSCHAWKTLLLKLPKLKRLRLPRECKVPHGDAVTIAGRCCKNLELVHLNTVWDISSLAALPLMSFPVLTTIIVDSIGDYKRRERSVLRFQDRRARFCLAAALKRNRKA